MRFLPLDITLILPSTNVLILSIKRDMIVAPHNPVPCRVTDHEHDPVEKALLATSRSSTALSGGEIPLGLCIPPNTPHAVCSSIPTWKDNVAYAERKQWAVDAMKTGYPRFNIHESVQRACISQDLAIRVTDGIFSLLICAINVSAPLGSVVICFLP